MSTDNRSRLQQPEAECRITPQDEAGDMPAGLGLEDRKKLRISLKKKGTGAQVCHVRRHTSMSALVLAWSNIISTSSIEHAVNVCCSDAHSGMPLPSWCKSLWFCHHGAWSMLYCGLTEGNLSVLSKLSCCMATGVWTLRPCCGLCQWCFPPCPPCSLLLIPCQHTTFGKNAFVGSLGKQELALMHMRP